MNISLYLDEKLNKELSSLVRTTGKPRGFIIKEAIKDFISKYKRDTWTKEFLQFKGSSNMDIDLESHKNFLKPIKKDIF